MAEDCSEGRDFQARNKLATQKSLARIRAVVGQQGEEYYRLEYYRLEPVVVEALLRYKRVSLVGRQVQLLLG